MKNSIGRTRTIKIMRMITLLLVISLFMSCSQFISDLEGDRILFDSRGGSSIEDQVLFGDRPLIEEPEEPQRTGYCFCGWYCDEACNMAWDFSSDHPEGSMTLYAKWVEELSVSFDSQGGDDIADQAVASGSFATEPSDPEKEGYSFLGWYTDAAATQQWDFTSDPVTSDLTLYAGWQTAMKTLHADPVISGGCFGSSLALDGDHLIVGALDFMSRKGSVYSLKASDSGWVQEQRILPADGNINSDRFGYSVDVSGDYMIVGQDRDSTNTYGAVCLYHYDGSSWQLMETIYEPGATRNNYFGRDVAIDGEYAVVGAAFYDRSNSYSTKTDAGRAYVLHLVEGSWSSDITVLEPSDPEEGALFAHQVDISGNRLIIAADGDDNDLGSAYIFTREGGSWSQSQKLTAFDRYNGDDYGCSVSIDGDLAVVGAELDQMPGLTNPGSAFVYQYDGLSDSWEELIMLRPEVPIVQEHFGCSVAVNGNSILVGAPNHREDDVLNVGCCYLFTRDGEAWDERILLAQDRQASDYLGRAIAYDGTRIITSSSLKKVDGRTNAGLVYLFE